MGYKISIYKFFFTVYKMMKRGQVTIFIIIAIIIVASIALVFSLNDNARSLFTRIFNAESRYPETVQDIKLSVQYCLDESFKAVIEKNALQGGFYFSPVNSIYYDSDNLIFSRNVPVYFNKGYSVPTLAVLRDQISQGVFYELAGCMDFEQYVNGSVDINNAKVDIDFSRYNARTTINEDSVSINIKFPVEVSFDGVVYNLEDYSSNIKTNYLKMYRLASEISQIQGEYGDEVCLTCNAELADRYEAQLLNEDYYEDDDNYVIIYNILMSDPLDDKIEIWSFAHRLRR